MKTCNHKFVGEPKRCIYCGLFKNVNEEHCKGCGLITEELNENKNCLNCVSRQKAIEHLKHKKKTHSEVVRDG